ncbi:MAG TPA: peptidoglycan-binding domain-containing protein [Candidatus Binatia bacterium]
MTDKRLSWAAVLLGVLAFAPLAVWGQVRTQSEIGIGGATKEQGQKGIKQETPSSSAGMATSSDDIKKLQQALKDRGQDPGPINGVMGPKTQEALKAFQRQQGVNATGTLDLQTRSALGLGTASSPSGKSGSPAEGTSIEPRIPNDPSFKPGQPLPPETPSPGMPSQGSPTGKTSSGPTSPGGTSSEAGGAAGR